jgi:phage shock protein A
MKAFSRLKNLLRGLFAQWVGHRERRNPAAVYEAAIQERAERYRTLRGAAAGVLYVRSKLGRQLEMQTTELMHLRRQLDIAVDRDDDRAALALIARRDAATAETERLTQELSELTQEAETAKANLVGFQGEIARLKDEKVRMMARLANAKLRLGLRETLNGLSTEADIQALDAVRDHINRLVTEAQVHRDLGDSELENRLASIRDAEAVAAARAQLDELKRSRGRNLLPVVLPETARSQGGDGRRASVGQSTVDSR